MGGILLGWRTVCAVEIDTYCRSVLLARQRDGMLEPFPIWDDICTFDGHPWRGSVDIVSGGFPCQDISSAGKGAGIDGARSGLWREMARVVREVGPRYVLVENSPMLTSRGLGVVLGDLAAMGFDARWGVLGAVDAGAPHRRDRIWILANASKIGVDGTYGNNRGQDRERPQLQRQPNGCRRESSGGAADTAYPTPSARSYGSNVGGQRANGTSETEPRDDGETWNMADTDETRLGRFGWGGSIDEADRERPPGDAGEGMWWFVEPGLGRVAHGVANRMDRIRALGNGQVPAVVAGAWEVLHDD